MKIYEIKNKKAFTSVEYIVIVVLALLVLGIMFSTFGKQQSYADRILITLGLKTNNIDNSFNKKCGFEVNYIDIIKEKVAPADTSCNLVQNGLNNSWVCLGSDVFLFFKIGVKNLNEKDLILYPVVIVEKCEDEYFTKCKKIDEIGSLGSKQPLEECSVASFKNATCVNSKAPLEINLIALKKDIAYYRIKPKVEVAKDTCGTNKIESAQKDSNMIFVTVYKSLDIIPKKDDCLAFDGTIWALVTGYNNKCVCKKCEAEHGCTERTLCYASDLG